MGKRSKAKTDPQDIEDLIREKKREARAQGNKIELHHPSTRAHIANIWPDGKVDVTFAGQRVVGLVPR
jgi:hypothetical protein